MLKQENRELIQNMALPQLLQELSDHTIGCDDAKSFALVLEALSTWAETNLQEK